MHHRHSTLVAVATVLAAVGLIASCTSSGGAGSVSDGAAAASTAVPLVEAPVSTLAQVGATTSTAPTATPTSPVETSPPGTAPATAPPTLPQYTTTVAPATTVDIYAGFTKVPAPTEPIPAVGTADGEATRVVQQRLLDLGFWLAAVDGEYGTTTRQAVMAFQKYHLIEATGEVDPATAELLTTMPIRAVAAARTGDLVEINKATQLLFVVRGGVTMWVFNASTGNGLPYEEEDQNTPGKIVRDVALTPDGEWKVNRERPEGWWDGDLGQIYRPKYFKGGVAVHGSGSVPNYPASHGCVRVTVAAMDFIWERDLMPMRSKVWVHS